MRLTAYGRIYQIQRMLQRPHDLLEHRHCNLLQEICREIGTSKGVVHLIKVPVHTGTAGNEEADRIATDVTKERRQDNTATAGLLEDMVELPRSNRRAAMWWG